MTGWKYNLELDADAVNIQGESYAGRYVRQANHTLRLGHPLILLPSGAIYLRTDAGREGHKVF